MGMFESDGKAIFTVFLGAIIVLGFMGIIADQIDTGTVSRTFTNQSVLIPANSSNPITEMSGRELLGAAVIKNWTEDVTLANLTVSTVTSPITGLRTVALTASFDDHGIFDVNG